MSNYKFNSLKRHVGHDISVVTYGDDEEDVNVSIECNDCHVVLHSIDRDSE